VLPALAAESRVVAVEFQGHGHTADIDRPLSFEQLADDTAALLGHLEIEGADIFGFSVGANTALQLAIRHPNLVRKLVVASPFSTLDGYYREVVKGIAGMTAEDLAGSPWQEEYARIAPNPANWPALVAKVSTLVAGFQGWPADDIRSIHAPTLLIIGDADVVRPEHAVELFRLRGGGVPGDLTGLPDSQLAVLPGTSHVTLPERAAWLPSMIASFLDAPMPEAT
jgi:pimeloyl-ACP methyl ester carboxylesterase